MSMLPRLESGPPRHRHGPASAGVLQASSGAVRSEVLEGMLMSVAKSGSMFRRRAAAAPHGMAPTTQPLYPAEACWEVAPLREAAQAPLAVSALMALAKATLRSTHCREARQRTCYFLALAVARVGRDTPDKSTVSG